MKIGIMTMQRIYNYGSFLQAFALKELLENNGNDVIFVDYIIGRPILKTLKDKRTFYKKKYAKVLMNVALRLKPLWPLFPKSIRYALSYRIRFEQEYFRLLGITQKHNYHPQLDILVIGSDEVFNCTQLNPDVGYSLDLFGANANTKKIITYAASFGNTTIQLLSEAGKANELSSLLSKIDSISVRDENSFQIINKLTGQSPNRHLDPVLIYDFSKIIPMKQLLEKNYILLYAYRGRISKDEQASIRAFAKKEGKQLLAIGGYHPFCEKNIICSPFEVLQYFSKADYIITDTFHGSIFAIINNRQFCTFIRKSQKYQYGNSEKLIHLLETLGLQNRIVKKPSDLGEVLKIPIDYNFSNLLIEEERNKTIRYLKENMYLDT